MSAVPAVSPFVAALPKAELHLHLVGSASPETVLELARRYPSQGLPDTLDGWRELYTFHDFPHFLQTYLKVAELVRTERDVRTLLLGLARDAAASNVRYAEVTVTVEAHLAVGMDPGRLAETMAEARETALREHGITLNWIFDIPDPDPRSAERTVDFAVNQRPPGTVALGVAGPEIDSPRARFRKYFNRAAEAGLHRVPHAGETTGPDEVWAAVEVLGAERIGHGIGAATDPELLYLLRDKGIPLEVCPTSNVATRAVERIEAHPLPVLLSHGVPVTLNTDDPGMFGTTLNREYQLAADTFGLSNAQLVEIARTGLRAAFCDETLRATLLAELDVMSE